MIHRIVSTSARSHAGGTIVRQETVSPRRVRWAAYDSDGRLVSSAADSRSLSACQDRLERIESRKVD